MHRIALVAVLAACGGSPSPKASTPAITNASAGGACPAASAVVMARWMEADDNNAPVTPGWRAYLANTSLDREGDAAYTPGPLAAGAPHTIWISSGDRAPCRATATGSFRQITNVGPVSEQTGVELTGCPKPDDNADFALGLIGDAAGACTLTYAKPVATRRGDFDESGSWKLDDASTPIPAALAPIVDHRACDAPCVALWNVTGAGDDAYDVLQTWMKSTTGEACSLEHDDADRIVVRADGKLVALPDADVGNQVLTGVFRDGGGPRMVVTEDVGELSVFTVALTPTLALHRVWFDKNEEDTNWRSMGPYCGP